MGMFDDLIPQGAPSGGGMFADLIPQPSVAADVAKSGIAGVGRGLIGLAGIPGGVGAMAASTPAPQPAPEGMYGKIVGALEGARSALDLPTKALGMLPTASGIQKSVEAVTGPFHQPQTTAGEYAETVGSFLPAVVGGEGSLGARLLRMVAAPAAASETAGQITKGTAAEPYARIAGAVAAPTLLTAGRRAVTPFPASAERQAAVETLRNEGVTDLTPGDVTGRKSLRYFESEVGGPRVEQMAENRKEQFTRAALRRVGEDAPRATPEVVDRAFERIGGEFDRLSANTQAPINPTTWQRLQQASQQYQAQTAPAFRTPIVENLVNQIGEAAVNNRGIMAGDVYKSVRSDLERARRGATDENLKIALGDIREALDDAMQRGLNAAGRPQDVAAWQQARRQYRNMMVIERAATGAGEDAAMGLISPSSLRNATVAQGRRAYARGQGDFADLARAGEAVLKPLPQSGTAPRLAARGVGALAGAALGGGGSDSPWGAAPGAVVGSFIAPRLMGAAMLSRPGRAVIANQALAAPQNAPPWLRQALINATLAGGANQ